MADQRKKPVVELSDTGHLGEKPRKRGDFKERIVNSINFLQGS